MSLSVTGLLAGLSVSRETLEDLRRLEALVKRWTPAINLISRSTVPCTWDRHVVDSAQLFNLASPEADHWLDIGSGGGFPGLVVSIVAKDLRPNMRVTLCESDVRKAAFLKEAVRVLGVSATVIVGRVETIPIQRADIISARALADLTELLGFAARHLGESGIALFLKGARHQEELDRAGKTWAFEVSVLPSVTDQKAAILKIGKIRSVSPN